MYIEKYLISKKVFTDKVIYWEITEHLGGECYAVATVNEFSKNVKRTSIFKSQRQILEKIQQFRELNIDLYKEVLTEFPEYFL